MGSLILACSTKVLLADAGRHVLQILHGLWLWLLCVGCCVHPARGAVSVSLPCDDARGAVLCPAWRGAVLRGMFACAG